jgi:peptide/nickel transport system ATP-binding protein
MALMRLTHVDKHFPVPPDALARLKTWFGGGGGGKVVHAVNDVSLDIEKGEVLGLVGESGCGKSTLARIVAGIHPVTRGEVSYKGSPVLGGTHSSTAKLTTGIQMVFQDPYASLNPRHKISRIIGEGPLHHKLIDAARADEYVCAVMRRADLDPAWRFRFPHQFSGGQRQRIGIARALAMKPEFLVCDEAVAALDVSIRAQVLNLFMELKAGLDLTYLFISHDLGVIRHVSDRVAVMYLGRIVELAPASELFARAAHPYTRALLGNMLTIRSGRHAFTPVKGEIPSPLAPPPGCGFHPRCAHAFEACRAEPPGLRGIGPGHLAACHLERGDELPFQPF